VHSIGRLQLLVGDKDQAASLEDRPVLAFLFKYLLARYVLGEPPQGRDGLGDELSPGVPESSQRKRLRKQLYDLQKDIAPPIAGLIHISRTHVWLELDQTGFDVGELRLLANRIRERGSMIDAGLAAEVQDELDRTQGQEFLPGFEELENKVNSGRGTAGQLVAQARELIANQRAELVRALAEYQDAMGHPEAAIGHLQAALEALPARQDLARLLVVAYLKTGQTARASEVRRQFALRQEE
jgi:DNA-binding SARP family transcriptional activator